jgi:hypothetical protein
MPDGGGGGGRQRVINRSRLRDMDRTRQKDMDRGRQMLGKGQTEDMSADSET